MYSILRKPSKVFTLWFRNSIGNAHKRMRVPVYSLDVPYFKIVTELNRQLESTIILGILLIRIIEAGLSIFSIARLGDRQHCTKPSLEIFE